MELYIYIYGIKGLHYMENTRQVPLAIASQSANFSYESWKIQLISDPQQVG